MVQILDRGDGPIDDFNNYTGDSDCSGGKASATQLTENELN